MKPRDSSRKSGAEAGSPVADFLFTGVVVVPGVFVLAGDLAGAFLLFIPLLFAACLGGSWDENG